MSIDADRIAQLEAELVSIRWQLELAGKAAHASRQEHLSLRRRIEVLTAQLAAERQANDALREGIAAALRQLKAIEAVEIALFGP